MATAVLRQTEKHLPPDASDNEALRARALGAEQSIPRSPGEHVRCLLRCALFASSRCARCSVPDHRGAPVCPRCGSRLYYLAIQGGRAQWLCGGKGCDVLISFPAGDPDQEAAADAELADLKREKARVRQRISRARRSARRRQVVEAG